MDYRIYLNIQRDEMVKKAFSVLRAGSVCSYDFYHTGKGNASGKSGQREKREDFYEF